MLEYLVYLIYRAGFALIGLLPLRAAFALGNALGLCAWLVLGKYRRLGFYNIYIDNHVRTLRGRAGVELFDRNEGFQKAIELLRGGGAIGILADQHAGDQGLWVPFFGKFASTTSLPALLAKRTGAAVLGTAIYTESPGRWRMSFTDRIDDPRARENCADLETSLRSRRDFVAPEQIARQRGSADWTTRELRCRNLVS